MSLGGRPCALGKKREIVPAVPMSWVRRMDSYLDGDIYGVLTPRQRRRMVHKKHAQEGRARRALAAELAAAQVKP